MDPECRELDWRLRSGRNSVSKTTRSEVGEEAEQTSAETAAFLMWCKERPPPWAAPAAPSRTGRRWRVVTPGSKIRRLWVSGMPQPSSITVRAR